MSIVARWFRMIDEAFDGYLGLPMPKRTQRHPSVSLFKSAAQAGIKHVASTREFFTADDIWFYLSEFNCVAPDGRALGGVLLAAEADGIISRTEHTVASLRQETNHGRRIAVWRSKIFGVRG